MRWGMRWGMMFANLDGRPAYPSLSPDCDAVVDNRMDALRALLLRVKKQDLA
jgi:hypothetical protein